MNDWKAKEAARAAAAAALAAANPHLITIAKEGDSLRAAGKNIRRELARAFPGVKFSVKSSRFSMGDSIRVGWIDGPNAAAVDAIIDKYESGTFDSMTDCAGYRHSAWLDAFGDAKYISSSRDNSDKAIASAIRTVIAKYGDAAAVATVAAYRKGELWNVYPSGGEWSRNNALNELISEVLYRRTWAIDKSPKAAAMVEESEAA
jgi:hypothetical protein